MSYFLSIFPKPVPFILSNLLLLAFRYLFAFIPIFPLLGSGLRARLSLVLFSFTPLVLDHYNKVWNRGRATVFIIQIYIYHLR